MAKVNILGVLPTINASACLLSDGEIIAMAEEERFNRIKTAGDVFPLRAIKYVLDEGKLSLKDINYIAVAWDNTKYPEFMRKYASENFHNRTKIDYIIEQIHTARFDPDFVKFKLETGLYMMGIREKLPEIKFIPHHLSHAASAFYMSGFDKSVILTVDGSGEENATVLWKGEGTEITKIKEINLPHSLGWFYAAITEFLGFKANVDEGKVMGLAPYGRENLEIRKKLGKIIKIDDDGYTIDATYVYFDKRTRSAKFTDKLVELLGEPLKPKALITEYYEDVAFEVQYALEVAVEKLVLFGIKKTGIKKVCIAGGVGMNCKMNGKINELKEVEDVFIIPPSSDNGSSLGSALYLYKEMGGNPKKHTLTHLYYGPSFSNEHIKKVLDYCKLKADYYENIEEVVAKRVADSKIVGWFQGRMEVGARALGNRSILANPLNKDMRDVLNAQVKHREAFRPFCPSILYEDMDKYVENAKLAPYMILAFRAKRGMKELLPSVVHVDNTVRVQTVRKEDNLRYWNLINEFKKITGEGVILNTSFNIAGEPIVCTPEEAIRCYFGTGIDCLALGNYFIEKDDTVEKVQQCHPERSEGSHPLSKRDSSPVLNTGSE